MKTTQLTVALGVAALALTSCSSVSEPTPTVTVTATVTAEPTREAEPEAKVQMQPVETQAPEQTLDEHFVEFVKSQSPVMRDVPDDLVVGLGVGTCYDLKQGSTLLELFDLVYEQLPGAINADIREGYFYTMGAGVAYYCPEYNPLTEEL